MFTLNAGSNLVGAGLRDETCWFCLPLDGSKWIYEICVVETGLLYKLYT